MLQNGKQHYGACKVCVVQEYCAEGILGAAHCSSCHYLLLAVSRICCHVVGWAGSAEAITHLNSVTRVSRRPAQVQVGDKQQHLQSGPLITM
jgi:hypothetical protein